VRATRHTSLPTHTLFPPARARAPTARHCCCGSHGNGGSARPSGGVGKLSRQLLCSSIVGTLPHDHKAGSRTRPQMLGRGALDVSGRLTTYLCMCVLHVCTCVCSLTGQTWWKPGRMLLLCTHVYHAVDCGVLSSRHRDGANWDSANRLSAYYCYDARWTTDETRPGWKLGSSGPRDHWHYCIAVVPTAQRLLVGRKERYAC
jgi:hypothetical protein